MKVVDCRMGATVRIKDDSTRHHSYGDVISLPIVGKNKKHSVEIRTPEGRVKTVPVCRLELKVEKMVEYSYAN